MRFSRFAGLVATAAPLLSRGSAAQSATPDALSYRLPFDHDNEAFTFNIQALEQPHDPACGNSQLQLQGQGLGRDWHPASHGDLIGTSKPSVVVRSERTGHNRNLDLTISSSCLSSLPLPAANHQNDDETASDGVVEHTTVLVSSVDSRPLDAPAGFNVYLDQQTGRVIAVTPASPHDISRVSNQHHLTSQDQLAQEQAHLDRLKSQLEDLTANVVSSEARIQELDPSQNPSCTHLSCAVVAFFRRIGGNIRILIQKLPSLVSDKCPRSQAVLGNCHGGADYSPSNSSMHNGTTSSHASGPSSIRLDSVRDHVVLSIILVLSIFCFSCVLFTVCRFCFSARAQVEWRATCEELRTRRQFRNLQRHHKLKVWWSRLSGRKLDQRTGDYDEKRRLILSQEHVLENVMQDEIYRIRVESGMTPEEAWDARVAADGTTESLPPYRAQVTDGPPSYRTSPSDSGSVSLSRSGSLSGSAPSVSDVTPDSSIANLSPRHSSETLRTDGSLV